MGKCTVPGCGRRASYYMGWKDKQGEEHQGFVCATHDKFIGRGNLMEYAGFTLEDAIAFEKDKEWENA